MQKDVCNKYNKVIFKDVKYDLMDYHIFDWLDGDHIDIHYPYQIAVTVINDDGRLIVLRGDWTQFRFVKEN